MNYPHKICEYFHKHTHVNLVMYLIKIIYNKIDMYIVRSLNVV